MRRGPFTLAKTMVSVLHKELEYKVGKLKYKSEQTNPNFQLVK